MINKKIVGVHVYTIHTSTLVRRNNRPVFIIQFVYYTVYITREIHTQMHNYFVVDCVLPRNSHNNNVKDLKY